MSYRPLPDGLTIRESEIDGLGLHATDTIGAGVDLGHARYYKANADGDMIALRTPLGGFVNHSLTPNCEMRLTNPEPGLPFAVVALLTLRVIEAGEELTVRYTMNEYEGKDWI